LGQLNSIKRQQATEQFGASGADGERVSGRKGPGISFSE